jgi:hypothetical protein
VAFHAGSLEWRPLRTKVLVCLTIVVLIGLIMYVPLTEQHRKERTVAGAGVQAPTPSPSVPQPQRSVAAASPEATTTATMPPQSPRPRSHAPTSRPSAGITFSGPVHGSIITQGQTGGQNTINLGVPPRRLAVEQEAVFLKYLADRQKGTVSISCQAMGGREPCDFARQLTNLLTTAGWEATLSEAMAFITYSGLYRPLPQSPRAALAIRLSYFVPAFAPGGGTLSAEIT